MVKFKGIENSLCAVVPRLSGQWSGKSSWGRWDLDSALKGGYRWGEWDHSMHGGDPRCD